MHVWVAECFWASVAVCCVQLVCHCAAVFEYLFAERAILDSSLRLWQWDAAGRESEERHCETESGCQAGLSRRSHRGHGRVRACGNQSRVVRESSPLATGRANGKRGIERRMRGGREMERCVCVCLCVYFCVCGWEVCSGLHKWHSVCHSCRNAMPCAIA
jgi:hypothetical protein